MPRPANARTASRHQGRAADGGHAELGVSLGADRVVDLRDRSPRTEDLDRELGGHHIAIVALGQREEQVAILGAGAAQHGFVGAVAADGIAVEVPRQTVERGRREIDDGDVVAARVERCREQRPDAPAADDHGFHGAPSIMDWRTTQTEHWAFLST